MQAAMQAAMLCCAVVKAPLLCLILTGTALCV